MARAFADRLFDAADANRQRTGTLEGLDLASIPFSEIEHFGWDHAKETSMLAHHIATSMGMTDATELLAVKTAGLMHDLGRTRPWQYEDENHEKRSAELALRCMRGAGDVWHQERLVSRVEQLILGHSLQHKDRPIDPLAQALWDADAYESARLSVGTMEGMRIFRQRTANDRLCTEWARWRENKMTWLHHRGWR